MRTLKIEMIHDLVCSWCPIGLRNVQQALRQLDEPVAVEWYFLPYELNPEMPAQGEEIAQHLMDRYGWSADHQRKYRQDLMKTANQAGLSYDFSKRTHYYSTAAAHRLMHWAAMVGKQVEVNEALIQSYFTDGVDIGQADNLWPVLEALGLDAQQAKTEMESAQFQQQLAQKYARVQAMKLAGAPAHIFNGRQKLSGVPAFIFNDQKLIQGSNSVDYFQQLFQSLLAPQIKTADVMGL